MRDAVISRVFRADLARRLARNLGTTVRLIPGCGHFTPEDRPAPIADAIAELAAEL